MAQPASVQPQTSLLTVNNSFSSYYLCCVPRQVLDQPLTNGSIGPNHLIMEPLHRITAASVDEEECKGRNGVVRSIEEKAPSRKAITCHDREAVRDVRPVKYGSASPPNPLSATNFVGRGGVWTCENCSERVMLPPNTKIWRCARCQTTMYTLPQGECPLDTFSPCCCWHTILRGN